MGKPTKTESFDLYNVDNFSVYVKKGIKAKNDTLRIFIRQFLFIKNIEVDGMLINY